MHHQNPAMAFLLDPFPLPGELGTPANNLPKCPLPPQRSRRQVVRNSCVKVLPRLNVRNKRVIGKEPKPPPRRADELRKLLSKSLPYDTLPMEGKAEIDEQVCSTVSPRHRVPQESNRLIETPEPVGGFSKLYDSVTEMVETLGAPQDSLDEKWSRIAEWIDSFHSKQRLSKAAEMCLDLYARLIANNDEQPPITTAFIILEQVMLMVLRNVPALKDVIRRVYKEITTAIYEQDLTDPAPMEAPDEECEASYGRFTDITLYREHVLKAQRDATMAVNVVVTRARVARQGWANALHRADKTLVKLVFRSWLYAHRKERGLLGYYENDDFDERGTFITQAKEKDDALASAREREHELIQNERHLRQQLQGLSKDVLDMLKQQESAQEMLNTQDSEITHLTSTIASLTEQLKATDSFREQLDSAQQQQAASADTQNKIVTMVLGILNKVRGGASEHRSKVRLWSSLDITQEVTPSSLHQWLSSIIELVPNGKEVPSWEAGPHLLQPFATVLHVLFPKVINEEAFTSFVAEVNFRNKATIFSRWLGDCGVSTKVTPEELAAPFSAMPMSPLMYQTIATLMFHAYSGGYVARVLDIPTWDMEETMEDDTAVLYKEYDALQKAAETYMEEGERWMRSATFGLTECVEKLLRQVLVEKTTEPDEEIDVDVKQLNEMVDDNADDLEATKETLNANASELKKIFTYYASSVSGGVGGKIMSEQEFVRFIVDAKLMGKSVTRQYLVTLFSKRHNDQTCTLHEWVILLVIISKAKYKVGPVSTRLSKLLSLHVLQNSKQMELDQFRKAIYSDKVQGILIEFNSVVFAAFKQYSEVPKGLSNGAPLMSKPQYDRFLHDIHITDQSCTSYMTDEIFKQIQDPDDDSEDLVFSEFCECLVTIAAVKRPEPYLPLHQRLRYVLETWLGGFKAKKQDNASRKVVRRSTAGSASSLKHERTL